MTPELYMDFVGTDTDKMDDRNLFLLTGMGAAGEAGEVCDELKKVCFHHKILNEDELRKEIGDVFWYLFALMRRLNMSFDEVTDANAKKLCERYPDRYGPKEDWVF